MPRHQRAIVTVTNDLSTDRRVERTCEVLLECGYQVVLLGRKRSPHMPLERPYRCVRMSLAFKKGPLFYAEYNLRALLFLLVNRASLIVSNDLDTLLACRTAQVVKGAELVYDSHEYFTEVPELEGRFARKVWLGLEKRIVPKLKHLVTVNDSIAKEYAAKYGVSFTVVRNMAVKPKLERIASRQELELPVGKTILIMQGSGINLDRGAEEALLAMKELPSCFLLLIGGGDAWLDLKQIIAENELDDRVRMVDRLPYLDMMQYTCNADLGLSLDKDNNLNYRFSLPNKVFDYLYAGIPVLSTDLPELRQVLDQYDAGLIITSPATSEIVRAVKEFANNREKQDKLKQNAKFAASKLDPQQEREKLKTLIARIGQ